LLPDRRAGWNEATAAARTLPRTRSGRSSAAGALTAADFRLVNPVGQVSTREQYLGALATRALVYHRWDPESIEVRISGDMAVLRYRSMLEVTAGGGRNPPRPHWHVDVYERRGGRWQVVWSQATFAS
jgi:hypothetical protein